MLALNRNRFIYPTNNFTHHHNVRYYFYNTYVTQGNNWANYGLHQVEVRNESENVVEVVSWHFEQGRLEEDFRVREVKPALFYTARVVPTHYGKTRVIRGAVVFKVKGSNQHFTLAFEDKLSYSSNEGFKGHIEEGNDWQRAILSLKDNKPKQLNWGSYQFKENEGRGKSIITIGKRRATLPNLPAKSA